eukprot:scaffold49448_cov25-Prasinocladus_malaysianus.AAC.2
MTMTDHKLLTRRSLLRARQACIGLELPEATRRTVKSSPTMGSPRLPGGRGSPRRGHKYPAQARMATVAARIPRRVHRSSGVRLSHGIENAD